MKIIHVVFQVFFSKEVLVDFSKLESYGEAGWLWHDPSHVREWLL